MLLITVLIQWFFVPEKLTSIIKSLNPNKAHGWDEISVRMIKISGDALIPPLITIFNNIITTGIYPTSWKKANIVSIHKKEDKTLVKNYRPISLLPILGKMFEKCIYDSIYSYFESNNLFTSCQSGFRKGDSCVSQLMSIAHKIFLNFDTNPTTDTRGVFLDISKAFDRVWHEGLLFKLKSYGITDNLLSLIKDFLSDRLQRVVLNGKASSWKEVLAGVPQGSILGPLFFLIYINELPTNMESQVRIFADDTSLFSVVNEPQICAMKLNNDLGKISEWARQWKMSFNPDITKQAIEVTFSKKVLPSNLPQLLFNNFVVLNQDVHKHLGLILDKGLTFDHHLKEKIAKANRGIGLIRRLRMYVPRNSLLCIYKAFVRPHLDYADIIYDQPRNDNFTQKLESVQYNAALAITGCFRGSSREKLYNELGLESLYDRRWFRKLIFFYKIINDLSPPYLRRLLPQPNVNTSYNVRNKRLLHPFAARTDRFQSTFFPFCVIIWNNLDPKITNLPTVSSFKSTLLKFIRPNDASVYSVHEPLGVVLLTRLRVGFSHLREHKFRHNFADINDPFCLCRTNAIETTEHYLLYCPNFCLHRNVLFDNLHRNGLTLLPYKSCHLTRILLYSDIDFSIEINRIILSSVIRFLLTSKRFEGSLFS